jgi:excinuclease UvrABC nuclease subunit
MNIINVNWNKMTESFGKAGHRGGIKGHILYMMKNNKGKVIRTGACTNLNDRMHMYKNHPQEDPLICKETTTVEYMLVKSRKLLLEIEKEAIRHLRPIYNLNGWKSTIV